jgi:hypothetical protein
VVTKPQPFTTNEEAWAAAAGWGAERRMNEIEALMWRSERHPRLSSTITVVEVLATQPEWKRFSAAHEWGARLVPRFRQGSSSRHFRSALPSGSTTPISISPIICDGSHSPRQEQCASSSPPEYPAHMEIRRVSNAGTFGLHHAQPFLSNALRDQHIGLEEVDDGIWSIVYSNTLLGKIDEHTLLITGV